MSCYLSSRDLNHKAAKPNPLGPPPPLAIDPGTLNSQLKVRSKFGAGECLHGTESTSGSTDVHNVTANRRLAAVSQVMYMGKCSIWADDVCGTRYLGCHSSNIFANIFGLSSPRRIKGGARTSTTLNSGPQSNTARTLTQSPIAGLAPKPCALCTHSFASRFLTAHTGQVCVAFGPLTHEALAAQVVS